MSYLPLRITDLLIDFRKIHGSGFFKCLVTVVDNLKHNKVVAGPAIREKVTGVSQRRIKNHSN